MVRQYSKRDNCLTLIRLLAAFQVFYGHVRTHLSISMPSWFNQMNSIFLGVPIFFTLSGYLVWNSVKNSNGMLDFYKKRFFRIYPELWCAVFIELITVIIFYADKIEWKQFILFAIGQATIFQFYVPDFLSGYGVGAPNGALWTIYILIQFYFAVWFIYKLVHKRGIYAWNILLCALVIITVCMEHWAMLVPEFLYRYYKKTLVPYLFMFMFGALLAEYKEKMLPIIRKYWWAFLLFGIFAWKSGWDIPTTGYHLIQAVVIPYGMIGFAYRFPKLDIPWDISYGIYLYHMTVVNAMIMMGKTGKKRYLLIALLVSLLLAWISTITVGRIGKINKG